MNRENLAWQKLAAVARRAPDERETAAPYGFATRVAALAMAQERPRLAALLEQFSWRALAVAGALAAITLATNYSALAKAGAAANATATQTEEEVLPDASTVTAVFDVS